MYVPNFVFQNWTDVNEFDKHVSFFSLFPFSSFAPFIVSMHKQKYALNTCNDVMICMLDGIDFMQNENLYQMTNRKWLVFMATMVVYITAVQVYC